MTIINHFKTAALLGLLSALLIWIGSFFGPSGMAFGLVFAVIINFGSYFFSDKLVLSMYRAKETKEKDNPRLFRIVKRVAQRAKVPMPKVYIIPSQNANAFATGRNPKNAVVACTKGILDSLNDDELEGVVAHEFGHIKHRDILIATIAATIASVISYVAMMARWAAIFGGMGGDDREGGSGIIELLFLAILTPIIATILQLAISRSREYLADEYGAKLTRKPEALALALEKISRIAKSSPMRTGKETTASLFIINPFNSKSFMTLFSTHPDVNERVGRLRNMSF